MAKAEQLLPSALPPQATTLDKDHGRTERRELCCVPTGPVTMGLAGVAQVMHIHCHTQEVRRGRVTTKTDDVRFAATYYGQYEAGPQRLRELDCDHWSIENGQFYRQDRTQDEDRCPMRETTAACNLSLFQSRAVFLRKAQSRGKGVKKSLSDFERHVHRKPCGLIRQFTQRRHEE